jgi:DNA-directed RNA polymerase subunit K/omega
MSADSRKFEIEFGRQVEVRKLVPRDERRFPRYMSKYELIAIISARAEDLASDPQIVRVDNSDETINPIELACRELEAGRIFFNIFRPVITTDHKLYEKWTSEELIVNKKYLTEVLQLISENHPFTHRSEFVVDAEHIERSLPHHR